MPNFPKLHLLQIKCVKMNCQCKICVQRFYMKTFNPPVCNLGQHTSFNVIFVKLYADSWIGRYKYILFYGKVKYLQNETDTIQMVNTHIFFRQIKPGHRKWYYNGVTPDTLVCCFNYPINVKINVNMLAENQVVIDLFVFGCIKRCKEHTKRYACVCSWHRLTLCTV